MSKTPALKYRRRARLHAEQRGMCYYCKRPMVLSKGNPLRNVSNHCTIDHIVPRSKGGANEGNVVAACFQCNNERGDRDARLFLLEKQGFMA